MNTFLFRFRMARWAFANPSVLTMLHFEMLREGQTRLSRGQQPRSAWFAQSCADKLTRSGMPRAAANVEALG